MALIDRERCIRFSFANDLNFKVQPSAEIRPGKFTGFKFSWLKFAGAKRAQGGFTMVEIAIVLVIIGLLIGGMLKAQQLVNSAHVRNLADSATAVQTAYFGFVDRYRQVPGDWANGDATLGIGVNLSGGGNNNGRLDNPSGASLFSEPNALWEQLQQAGFIRGNYLGLPEEPTSDNQMSPLSAFGTPMLVGRTSDYLDSDGAPSVRLQAVIGRAAPVAVIQELDRKLDDGRPGQGVVRASAADGDVGTFTGVHSWGGSDAACTRTVGGRLIYDIQSNSNDCNAVMLF